MGKRQVSVLVVVAGMSMICYATVQGLVLVAPVRWNMRSNSPLIWCAQLAGMFYLALNFFWNYYRCVTTDAGSHDSAHYARVMRYAPPGVRELSSAHAEHGNDPSADSTLLQDQEKGGWVLRHAVSPLGWSTCAHTKLPKPPRAHYCRVTEKLVLNMDHYCIWVVNVVGYANYRYYFLSLFYFTAGCLYGLAHTYLPYIICKRQLAAVESGVLQQPLHDAPQQDSCDPGVLYSGWSFGGVTARYKYGDSSSTTLRGVEFELWFILYGAVICTCASSALLCWTTYLMCTAQSTIEYRANVVLKQVAREHGEAWTNCFSHGSVRLNCAAVLGNSWRALLLPSSLPPPWPPYPMHDTGRSRDLAARGHSE